MALTSYQQQTQRLLHDPRALAYSLSDITVYINLARAQIAQEAECIRARLSGGTVVDLTITNGGAGYVSPVITFTGQGAQTFATATQVAGVITSVTLTDGGWGWVPTSSLTVTVTDSGGPGAGAVITATVNQAASTVTGQEVITFATLNNLLTAWNSSLHQPQQNAVIGTQKIIRVFDIACNQAGTYKPMLQEKVWSEFQAYLRIYSNTQQNYPIYWSQYSQGDKGSIYLFPWPAQALQLDVDVCVLPIDLTDDTTVEAIPYGFTDAVPYWAAYLAYENSSRKDDADRMFQMASRFIKRARAFSEHPFMPDYYGYEY